MHAGPRGLTLSAVNRVARRAGLAPGLPLADARAALPGLLTRPADPAADAAALTRLALWAGRYGPSRNVDGVDGLWIDVTGVAHLFASEAGLVGDLQGRLARMGLTAAVGLADTLGAAHALARYARCRPAESNATIAPVGATRNALADLPVAALRIAADTDLLLRRLGLGRIGALAGLPRAALARRFRDTAPRRCSAGRRLTAEAAAVLLRLDQALGTAGEPRPPLREPPSHEVASLHAEPLITATAVEAAGAALADRLAATLEPVAAGARRLRLALYRVDGTLAEIHAGTSAPCRDPRHLWSLLAIQARDVDAGFGIDALALAAVAVDPLAATQAALPAGLAAADRWPPALLLDRLAARLGPASILRLASAPSHIPERASRRLPAFAATPPARDGGPAPAAAGPPPPPLLLARPEPVTVVADVPEGPPARLLWRRVLYRIRRAEGPQRIAPEWWRHLAPPAVGNEATPGAFRPRDYYWLEDAAGARLWVFRDGLYTRIGEDGSPAWYVHGLNG